jgi:hypothetical protein
MTDAAIQVIKVLFLDVFEVEVWLKRRITRFNCSVAHRKNQIFYVAFQAQQSVVHLSVLTENGAVPILSGSLDSISFAFTTKLK